MGRKSLLGEPLQPRICDDGDEDDEDDDDDVIMMTRLYNCTYMGRVLRRLSDCMYMFHQMARLGRMWTSIHDDCKDDDHDD